MHVDISSTLYNFNESSVIMKNGQPTILLGVRHYFIVSPTDKRPGTTHCPMDDMIDHVRAQNLKRPRIR